jgi:hypothetical protein
MADAPYGGAPADLGIASRRFGVIAVMTKAEIKPMEHHRIYDLVKKVGVDVSSWVKVKGGKANAPRNPKYCYEWSFLEPGKTVVLNLWHSDLQEDGDLIWRDLNLRDDAARPEQIVFVNGAPSAWTVTLNRLT